MIMNMVKAINLALHEAMREDDNVTTMGEDVGRDEGVFRVTEKLLQELRPDRDLARSPLFQIFFNDYNFEEASIEFDGLKARIIQHEYDHINGILFTDHLPALKKRLLKGKLQNISKGKIKIDYRIAVPKK